MLKSLFFIFSIVYGAIACDSGSSTRKEPRKPNAIGEASPTATNTGDKSLDNESGSGGSSDNSSSDQSTDGQSSDTTDSDGDGEPDSTEIFFIVSDDFSHTKELPATSACQSKGGDNKSPHLKWENIPTGTKYLTLIMDDEDSPCGVGTQACRHWQIYNIPVTVSEIKAGDLNVRALGNDVALGVNYDFSNTYAGPCPPNKHDYRFTLFALSQQMAPVAEGTTHTRASFRNQFSSFILGEAYIEGFFDGN